jgi:hypothetical protein
LVLPFSGGISLSFGALRKSRKIPSEIRSEVYGVFKGDPTARAPRKAYAGAARPARWSVGGSTPMAGCRHGARTRMRIAARANWRQGPSLFEPSPRERVSMILSIAHLQPIVSLIAGILILIVPRLLNYIVAIFLIVSGVIGLGLLR